MKTGIASFLACGVASLLVGCLDAPETSELGQETAGSGAVGTILARTSLGEAKTEIFASGHEAEIKGPTTLVMQEITVQPGGHTGWHTHGGLALVSIVSGALTMYDSHHPCDGTPFNAGTAFMDPGGGHVHIGRNRGTDVTLVRVQYILPTGAAVRIDAPAPAGADACP